MATRTLTHCVDDKGNPYFSCEVCQECDSAEKGTVFELNTHWYHPSCYLTLRGHTPSKKASTTERDLLMAFVAWLADQGITVNEGNVDEFMEGQEA